MKKIVKTRVTQGGRIVIPADVRKRLGIEIGDEVSLVVENDSLSISTRAGALDRIRRVVENSDVRPGSIVDDFLAERHREAENE